MASIKKSSFGASKPSKSRPSQSRDYSEKKSKTGAAESDKGFRRTRTSREISDNTSPRRSPRPDREKQGNDSAFRSKNTSSDGRKSLNFNDKESRTSRKSSQDSERPRRSQDRDARAGFEDSGRRVSGRDSSYKHSDSRSAQKRNSASGRFGDSRKSGETDTFRSSSEKPRTSQSDSKRTFSGNTSKKDSFPAARSRKSDVEKSQNSGKLSSTSGKSATRTQKSQTDTPKSSEKKAGNAVSKRATSRKAQREGQEILRLNKYIAEAGVCSRRKADELIAEGAVKVNRQVVTELGFKVSHSDFITVNGEPINAEQAKVYYVLNKPKGYLTTVKDDKDRKTVLDIVQSRYRIFPIGRLDRPTTGVLLLSNDGELAHHLTHPSYEIIRTYRVKLDKKLLPEHARQISQGVELDEEDTTAPCEVIIVPEKKDEAVISLREGKNREVRRLFEHFGYEVVRLDRKVFAGITCRGMKRGEYRTLTRDEIRSLEELVGLDRRAISQSQTRRRHK